MASDDFQVFICSFEKIFTQTFMTKSDSVLQLDPVTNFHGRC